jgi:rhodanese-related sulfurtransferase
LRLLIPEQVLDVRDPADFEGAHLAGSINIGLGGQYATWAAPS